MDIGGELVVLEIVENLVEAPFHVVSHLDEPFLFQVRLRLRAEEFHVTRGRVLDVEHLHMGVGHVGGVAAVEAVTVEDICERLEIATHVGLVALTHVLEHFVDGLLDGVEFLVYLRDCGCHEQRRWIVRHLRDACGDVALDYVEARLPETLGRIAVGSHEATTVLERLEHRRVKRIAKLIGRLEQHRHAHCVGDGAECQGSEASAMPSWGTRSSGSLMAPETSARS